MNLLQTLLKTFLVNVQGKKKTNKVVLTMSQTNNLPILLVQCSTIQIIGNWLELSVHGPCDK